MEKTMQERIREEIDKKKKSSGKTLKQMSDEIEKECGYSVSTATLSELQNDTKKGFNHNIIKAVAQYFGVSADYLLGLSPHKTTNAKLQAVCKYTGLSEDAVRVLSAENKHSISCLCDFVSCLVSLAYRTRIPFVLDDLSACTNILAGMYSFDGIDTLEKLETLWDDVDDLETNINGMKYAISRFLGDVIDEYSVSDQEIDYADLMERKEEFEPNLNRMIATYHKKEEVAKDEE